MEAALDGLAGIIEVEVDLSRDAFSVTYDPSEVTPEEIQTTIADLGFQPRIDRSDGSVQRPEKPSGPIPEPVASALMQARTAHQMVFVDFYAEWCAPCKVIDGKVIPHPRVQKALEGFVFVRVDADADQGAGERFGVFGMPTLLVLDDEGGERFRHVGLIEPVELAEKLIEISASTSKAGVSD